MDDFMGCNHTFQDKTTFYEGCLILGNESISNFYKSIIQSFAKNFEATIE
jgi:hypothetical protein